MEFKEKRIKIFNWILIIKPYGGHWHCSRRYCYGYLRFFKNSITGENYYVFASQRAILWLAYRSVQIIFYNKNKMICTICKKKKNIPSEKTYRRMKLDHICDDCYNKLKKSYEEIIKKQTAFMFIEKEDGKSNT